MGQIYAIANCRVSSDKQILSGSLDRQGKSVERMAKDLGVDIIKTWSGSVSSKAGTNVSRTDLEQMLDACKKNKSIKYAIFDELDRFMRSILEVGYFVVAFKKLGVSVLFASQPNLKSDTALDKLLMMLEAFKAEGSNEERQHKSIDGQTAALNEGRYTCCPKPGYMKGARPGIHEVHPVRGPALKSVLKRLAAGVVTPTNALIELNNSDFMLDHAPYKMDKFQKIATDPYNAGIVEIHKQVDVRNEHGLHEPLISLIEHRKLIKIMSSKPKFQTGPNKQGNPKYPLNGLICDDSCLEKKNRGKLVGFDHGNGKSNTKKYKKYRCRSCGRYWQRADLHSVIEELFEKYELPEPSRNKITSALQKVWKQNEVAAKQEVDSLQASVVTLKQDIALKVEAATDPSNASIKDDILALIENKKAKLVKLEVDLDKRRNSLESDEQEFLTFALSFVSDIGSHILDESISKDNRLRCKQLLFPEGIMIDKKNKVYTPEISPLYRLATKKKDAEASISSHLVRVRGL